MTRLIFLQRFQVARSDLFYTTKDGDKKSFFAVYIEGIQERVELSFNKKEFVDAVAFGKLRIANKAKMIGTCHQKATLVYMSALPQVTQDLLTKGNINKQEVLILC